MEFTQDTLLKDILAQYPWLKEEAIRQDDRFKMLDSPLGRILLKKATIADASKYSGFPAEEIIGEIQRMIQRHQA